MEHPKTPATMPFLANILCTSANKVEKSSTKVANRSNVKDSFPMTITAAVPLALGVAMVTYWTIFLRHSRRELNSLEDESLGVWLDGSTMVGICVHRSCNVPSYFWVVTTGCNLGVFSLIYFLTFHFYLDGLC